ncbi:hypothetical protein FH972_005523 [Carpinus fangiana]|uniref:Uncharacterized protein n=1 Tax=Carpinus fangiana TaxID=176857 RepID=A0A5N6QPI9_9ROSI|nr:hypothetical protein FH972_005523 [Carpinus fangiana]
MADWVLEMESDRGDVEGVGFEVLMPMPVDAEEVDASNDGEEAKGDECKNLVGFQWGWVFWVGSIQQQKARIGFFGLFPLTMQEENLPL